MSEYTKERSADLFDAIKDERYDRAEDAMNDIFAHKAAPLLDQQRVSVAKEFFEKKS